MDVLLEKFNLLNSLAKSGWTIEINEHRQTHETITEWVESTGLEVDTTIWATMAERDEMVVIFAYPRNTMEFLHVIHYDLVMAMDEMIKHIHTYLDQHPGSL